MWIFTQEGMISVVQNNQRRGHVLVRARTKACLPRLLESAKMKDFKDKIEHTIGNDYEFRISLPSLDFRALMSGIMDNLTYDNFKAHLHKADKMDPYQRNMYSNVYMEALKLARNAYPPYHE
tara:strand:+ start:29926 stop:30291 length:366 start_codon:yes stop_codon:yes gene_type:complete